MADRVLLVDDNLTNLQVLYQALEEEGYELLVAQSGEEALEIAGAANPSVILLDINMPGMDGYETCRRLKADPELAKSVVVFLSARGDLDDKLAGFDSGAVDYINKPFQFEEVVARVKKHLETFHREKDLESEKSELQAKLGEGFREFSEESLKDLIAGGENQRVEFKSTLRHNLRTDKPDKKMENGCLKNLAAYLNSSGGVLCVGVDDEGIPLGLGPDNFPNEDKILLYLTSMICNHLGSEIATCIKSSVITVEGNQVLVVECLRSPQPVYFRRDSEEFFFVRTGPSTRSLSPSEVVAYLENRGA